MRFIDREEVARRLTYEKCIPIVREAMIAFSRGETRQLLRSIIPLADGRMFGVMPGAMGERAVFGAKLISVFPDNFARGVQSHQGLVILFDPAERRSRLRSACRRDHSHPHGSGQRGRDRCSGAQRCATAGAARLWRTGRDARSCHQQGSQPGIHIGLGTLAGARARVRHEDASRAELVRSRAAATAREAVADCRHYLHRHRRVLSRF